MTEDTIILKCSGCYADIVEIWLSEKEKDRKTKVIANCYKCSDSSFSQEISGVFFVAAADGCAISETTTKDNGTMVIKTIKG